MPIPLAALGTAFAKGVGAAAGKLLAKVQEWGKTFMVYRVGKRAQQHQDMEKTVDMAERARRIEESVDDLPDSELDDRLRRERRDS